MDVPGSVIGGIFDLLLKVGAPGAALAAVTFIVLYVFERRERQELFRSYKELVLSSQKNAESQSQMDQLWSVILEGERSRGRGRRSSRKPD